MAPTPTPEQHDVIDAYKTGKNLVIEAGAGAGKTSTLKMAAASTPGRKGLYIAYNKSIQMDAEKSFPKDVTCKTAHGLAFGSVGRLYARRLRMPRMRGIEIAKLLRINEPLHATNGIIPPAVVARIVMGTVAKFCNSAHLNILDQPVPRIPGFDDVDTLLLLAREIPRLAAKAWDDICRVDGKLPFSHDAYLKIYSLSDPQLPYEYVLMDESQDANPPVTAIVEGQRNAQKVLVGDSSQAIYCQPVGTMVEVPIETAAADPGHQCAFDGCPRRRDHIASGLCDLHERQSRDGLKLTPTPRRPKAVSTCQVPIETLAEGDMVVTYDNGHVFLRGREITGVTRFPYEGALVRVTTGTGLTSAYTLKHHCIARMGDDLRGKHVVYLMRRGDQFRIGRVPAYYGSQGNTFGLVQRAKSEGADAAWILSVHETLAETSLAEALAQAQFNIPGIRFEPSGDGDVLDVRAFWDKLGPNQDKAAACLEHYGRLLEFPLWTDKMRLGIRRPFVTAAANLIDGFLVLPVNGAMKYKNKREYVAPHHRWELITVTREWYAGDIVSLEVADHHTYFSDGILTHNSWRGAVDAMANFDGVRLTLSQSFRFGPAVAEEANKWLEYLDAPLRLRGFEQINSRLASLAEPDAVLCRTNASTIAQAMEAMQAGRRVALVGDGKGIRALAEAAIQLKAGAGCSHPELYAFKTWQEVQDYCENEEAGSDLAPFVKLVDSVGADVVLDIVGRLVSEDRADLVLSTAHKAKGREWHRVKVAGDFPEPKPTEDDKPGRIPRADAMLAYVTVTRAQYVLDNAGLDWIDKYR
ncbi:AAA family ATPase [Sphaerisporangium viridialbum]|uniref:AAA family ATPase n=1 Tax=Sphaerisporangium viridialbum TaxID=46189 RepID=UPI003C775D76